VQNTSEAWWYALNNIDPQRDVIFTKGPADVLDHSAQHFSFGTKMGLDGTRKWPDEGFTRPWPDKIVMSDEIKKLVDSKWKSYGI
jgi:4-hydroxy-3-polyprenylbenzoate decarboxylase